MKPIVKDFPKYCKHFLKIIDKDGQLTHLELNVFQKKMAHVIEQMEAEGRPARIIVLKARQVGGSTFGAALIFFRTTKKYIRSFIMAHDSDSTSNLFGMIKLFI